MSVTVSIENGWQVVHVGDELVEVAVLPGKGGDILAVTWLPLGLNVLWRTPWGLRAHGSASCGGDSFVHFLENYPGGWQTLFPNGGTETQEQGVALPFHGEATAIPWVWESESESAVHLTTHLVRSPFELSRQISVNDATVTVQERFRNTSKTRQPAMWSHHPAFGAPFLDDTCHLETGATKFVADTGYDTTGTDLIPGALSDWPKAAAKAGGTIDLRAIPGPDAGVDRFGYLLDFNEPWYAITNPTLGLKATMRWNPTTMPHAWLWCEAQSSAGFPWHQRAYVLAVEPASSYPGAGLAVARDQTDTVLWFEPGEERSAEVSLQLQSVGAPLGR